MAFIALVSCVPSRNTGQGAYRYGKPKPLQGGGEGKPSSRNASEEKRVKVRRVIAARLETRRSIPEQDEVGRKPDGGLKQF